jgi:hypothetical protein
MGVVAMATLFTLIPFRQIGAAHGTSPIRHHSGPRCAMRSVCRIVRASGPVRGVYETLHPRRGELPHHCCYLPFGS